MYTTDANQVSANGATGGLVVICSNGDFAADDAKKARWRHSNQTTIWTWQI